MTRRKEPTDGVSKRVLMQRASSLKYYRNNKDKCRNQMYKYLYGITLDQYGEMLERQQGVCCICGKPPEPLKAHRTGLVPDHNHTTGKVRSLLCYRCNLTLGTIEKDIPLAIKMLQYLGETI